MNHKEGQRCSSFNTEGDVRLDVQASQIPLEQLKLHFQDIIFNPKYTIGADHFLTHLNSGSQTASITDSTSLTLDYEDLKGHHSVLSEEGIQSLRVIAETLCSSTGQITDCFHKYIEHRKDVVNMVHRRLHEKLDAEEVCVFMYWEGLNEKIQRWIKEAKICVGTLFVIEKSFYEQVFGGLMGTVEEDGFFCIIAEVVGMLFNYPESLLANRRVPQRLDALLPLLVEFYNLYPDVIAFFKKDSQVAKKLHVHATGIMSRFKPLVMKILSATEGHILRELSVIPTPKGEIHRLTEYVINYLDLFATHKKALVDLITESDRDQRVDFLKQHLIRVIDFLSYNLKVKSNFYDEESLSHLFMMNNVHSVAQKIKSSQELEEIIGDQFQLKLEKRVELWRNGFLYTTWSGICHFLRDEAAKPHSKCNFFPAGRSSSNKFKAFNRMFDHVYQTQVEWKVADQQLRERLLGYISVFLIPAYKDFFEQFSPGIHKFKHPSNCIKYSVKDLEIKVLNLY